MLTGIFIAIVAIGIVLMTRSITVLIHELGHAIPSLLFTKEEVIICVGSYENLTKSKGIKLGRLTTFFTFNIFNWNSGLCLHKGVTTFIQNFLIILGGPLASLLIGLGMIYVVRNWQGGQYGVVVAVFLIVSALWDFISNIIPHDKPLVTHNGNIVYNDGYQLKRLLQQNNLATHQQQALKEYQLGHYDKVLGLLKADGLGGLKTVEIQRTYIESLLHTRQLEEAEETFYHYFGQTELKSPDFSLIAEIKMEQQQYENALQAYDRAVYLDFTNPLLHDKKGLCHTNLADYEDAVIAFSKSILHNPDFYQSMVNRAYALIKLERLDLAEQDLSNALALNDTYPKTYFCLGLLKKELGAKKEALNYLLKAQKMGFEHHGLDYYIAEVS